MYDEEILVRALFRYARSMPAAQRQRFSAFLVEHLPKRQRARKTHSWKKKLRKNDAKPRRATQGRFNW